MPPIVTSNGYESHLRLLTKYAIMAPEGSSVCELGLGFYSSPVLYSICEKLGLEYHIYYSDEAWATEVKKRLGNRVTYHRVADWKTWVPDRKAFLYMLDNEELVVNRFKTLAKIAPLSEFVLVHDADTYTLRGVPLAHSYTLGDIDASCRPHTAIVDCRAKEKIVPPSAEEQPKPEELIILPVETDSTLRTAVVCAYVAGGDYDSHYLEYISRLSDGLKKTTPAPDFFCVTYMSLEGMDGVTRIQPLNNFKGWHIKGEVFNPELWLGYDRVLYFDLDTVIASSIADMLQNKAHFGMLRDFNRPTVMETGVIYFDPTLTGTLYEEFVGLNPNVRKKDSDIVNAWLKKHGLDGSVCPLQDHFAIGSYKVDIIKKRRDSADFSIVCFHGIPRPHHVGWNTSVPELAEVEPNGKVKYRAKPVISMWSGQDCFIIGGGPSVGTLDLSALQGMNVLGVNDAYQLPCTSACFFGDTVWEGHHAARLAEWGKPIFSTSGIHKPQYHHLDMVSKGISKDARSVGWNKNSGFASINLACHLGASRIFLVGFDMQFKDGESNYHPNIRKVAANTYKVFLGNQQAVADGLRVNFPRVKVYNANPESAMTVFPKITFQQAIEMAKGTKA